MDLWTHFNSHIGFRCRHTYTAVGLEIGQLTLIGIQFGSHIGQRPLSTLLAFVGQCADRSATTAVVTQTILTVL